MKILLDTNIILSALGIRSVNCLHLMEHCAEHHQLHTTPAILAEMERHLSGKFDFTPRETKEALWTVLRVSILLVPVSIPKDSCRDAGDLPILGAAVGSKCDCLITGDKDLLVLRRFRGVSILAPDDFWRFEDQQSRHRRG
jgi:uncharacterized protein